jgi:hypothetical protein
MSSLLRAVSGILGGWVIAPPPGALRWVCDLRIPLRGPDGEKMTDQPEQQVNEPEPEAETDGGG